MQEDEAGRGSNKKFDMKVLTMVLDFYTNIIVSGNEYTEKMLRETSIVHLLQFVLEQEFTKKEIIFTCKCTNCSCLHSCQKTDR